MMARRRNKMYEETDMKGFDIQSAHTCNEPSNKLLVMESLPHSFEHFKLSMIFF